MQSERQDTGIPCLTFLTPDTSGAGMIVNEVNFDFAERGAPFKVSRDSIEPGCSSIPDSHEVHEIWLIAEGQGQLLYDERPVRVTAGNVLYFEPYKTHQLHNDGDGAIVFFSLWWKG